jgi:hypothetical protein
MTLTIDLKPEIEASLSALAAAQGVGLAKLVEELLESQLPKAPIASRSAAERAAAWRAPVPGRPTRPALSDEAIRRETIYDARG